LVFLVIGCSTNNRGIIPHPIVNGTAYLEISSKNLTEMAEISSKYWPPILFFMPHEIKDSIAVDGEKTIEFRINVPSRHTIRIGKQYMEIFLVPGDTTKLTIDYQSKDDPKITFTETYGEINKYLMEKESIPRFTDKMQFMQNNPDQVGNPERTLIEYKIQVDSLYRSQSNFYKEQREKYELPNWFVDYELAEAELYAGYALLSILASWRYFNDIHVSPPEDYFEIVENIDLNRTENLFNPMFYVYMGFHLDHQFGYITAAKDSTGSVSLNLLRDFEIRATDAAKILDEQHWFPWVPYWFLSLTSKEYGSVESETAFDWLNDQISDTNYSQYIKTHYDDFNTRTLSGQKAPYIYLVDNNDRYYDLKDFEGEVLLLNFWFSGCKPCIAEIPYEKKLFKKYSDVGFKLINICTQSSKEKWIEALKKYDYDGINLFASGNWINKLTKDFKIHGYPHYTLVDRKGQIIKNATYRPSDPRLTQLLDSLLIE